MSIKILLSKPDKVPLHTWVRPKDLKGLKENPVRILLCAFAFLFHSSLFAQPAEFNAEYEARYGGFKATAERSLEINNAGQVELNTSLKLKLLGKTISSITEQSILGNDSASGHYSPTEYSFNQSGIGKRSRRIIFNHESDTAIYDDGKKTVETPLQIGLVDNLSSYLEVSRQLQQGKTEIIFPVMEKGTIEEQHFRVIAEELVSTRLGEFKTVKIEKIRGPESKRTTEMWLALDWDYLLVKLLQQEKGERDITLELKQALVNNIEVTGILSRNVSTENNTAPIVGE